MLSLLCASKKNKIEHYYIKGKVKNMETATDQLKAALNEEFCDVTITTVFDNFSLINSSTDCMVTWLQLMEFM